MRSMIRTLMTMRKGSDSINYIMYLTLAIIAIAIVIAFLSAGLNQGENHLFAFVDDFIAETGIEGVETPEE